MTKNQTTTLQDQTGAKVVNKIYQYHSNQPKQNTPGHTAVTMYFTTSVQ